MGETNPPSPPTVQPAPLATFIYSANIPNGGGACPFEEHVGPRANAGLGIFMGPGGKSAFMPLSEADAVCANIEPAGTGGGVSGEANAYCAKAKSVSVTLAFKENNSTYKVDKQNEFIFRIRLLDNTYHNFTGKVHPVSDGTSCFIQAPGSLGTCDASLPEWHCGSYEGAAIGGGTKGCVPE